MDAEKRLAQSLGVDLTFKKIKIGDYLINYVTAGKGDPVLLIHGGNIGWGQWYPNIPELSRYFKVYALDLPGGGRSSRIDFVKLDLEKHLVDVVARFVSTVIPFKPHVVGSSIGGWIGLKLSLRSDVEVGKLVVADSIGFTEYMRISDRLIGIYPLAKLLAKTVLKPSRENKNIERFLRNVFYNFNTPISKEFIDYFYETMETSHNLLFISAFSSPWGIRREFVLESVLPKITNETLIIWGDRDKLIPIEKARSSFTLIPKAKVVIIKEAGHIPSVEQYSEFNHAVVSFLRS